MPVLYQYEAGLEADRCLQLFSLFRKYCLSLPQADKYTFFKMKFEQIRSDKKRYMDLLLLADEQESMIDRYLERGEMFVLQADDGESVCVAVVTDEGGGICELKNIAVVPTFQGRGYGCMMVEYLCRRYGDNFVFMTVGTGESTKTVSFYKKCGFVYSHSVPDFFTLHYDHPIVEDGRILSDMLYFRKMIARPTVFREVKRTDECITELLQLWNESVRVSHHFLTEADIEHLTPFVCQALRTVAALVIACHGSRIIGFIGMEHRKIEMLFVSPDYLGCGFGRMLVDVAVREYGCRYVDVNAQNPQAAGFYRHLGFRIFERSETDGQGNPFPLLRMKLVERNDL